MADQSESHELDDLLDMAPLAALDALTELERARVTARLNAADQSVRDAFQAEVAGLRGTLADLSEATAQAPRPELRDELLDRARDDRPTDVSPTSRLRWIAAAAVVLVVGIGGGTVGYAMSRSDEPTQTTAERVFDSADVRTVSGSLATGRASVTFSPSTGAGVLVMNDVPPPDPDKVYQLWLVGPGGARLGGVMTRGDVAPSTTAVLDDLGDATSMAFTVGDATAPELRVGPPVAEILLG